VPRDGTHVGAGDVGMSTFRYRGSVPGEPAPLRTKCSTRRRNCLVSRPGYSASYTREVTGFMARAA
jgi:hypothetical protein